MWRGKFAASNHTSVAARQTVLPAEQCPINLQAKFLYCRTGGHV